MMCVALFASYSRKKCEGGTCEYIRGTFQPEGFHSTLGRGCAESPGSRGACWLGQDGASRREGREVMLLRKPLYFVLQNILTIP